MDREHTCLCSIPPIPSWQKKRKRELLLQWLLFLVALFTSYCSLFAAVAKALEGIPPQPSLVRLACYTAVRLLCKWSSTARCFHCCSARMPIGDCSER
ncbi:hypothetical protein GQ54DRAFT_113872 [Martensiomyces pterosporus]|nr:hypothetical protein GQ54DRAFT_113872 [Martensiomyces pterosporus]